MSHTSHIKGKNPNGIECLETNGPVEMESTAS